MPRAKIRPPSINIQAELRETAEKEAQRKIAVLQALDTLTEEEMGSLPEDRDDMLVQLLALRPQLSESMGINSDELKELLGLAKQFMAD